MDDAVALVRRSLADDARDPFSERVAEQADRLREGIAAGEFDNEGFAVGLELEVYAVDPVEDAEGGSGDEDGDDGPGRGALARLPESAFGDAANKELGLHNAEINTEPDPFTADGLDAQAAAIESRIERTRAAATDADREIVLDAMWTVPPEEGSLAYLSAVDDHDGVTVARNMRPAPRYLALDNDLLAHADGSVSLSVPGAEHAFPTILFESLATSIQPHLQVPSAAAFPDYYAAGIRTLGPVLSLTTNSPLLPSDAYDLDDPRALLSDTHHELRIAVFEQSVNTTPQPKVRVPDDVDDAAELPGAVVEDDLVAPFLREWIADGPRESPPDRYWEFDHKRGTYWRWLRCVIGGDPVPGAGDERSLRIEYRPIPTQPTARDVVACQALVAGLLRGIVAADHPLDELPREAAVESFYAAARDGPDADLAWVTADGERTGDVDVIHEELFSLARRGLAEQGVAEPDRHLAPIERRRTDAPAPTPSAWKLDRVREGLDDGVGFDAAVARMQRRYVELARERETFADF